jgi:hypothetical protein
MGEEEPVAVIAPGFDVTVNEVAKAPGSVNATETV